MTDADSSTAAPARRRRRRWLRNTVVILLAAALLPAVAWARVASLSAGRIHSLSDVPERAVAMVLGAKADPGRPSAFLAARLDVAIDLFERGKIRAILVTGDGGEASNNEPLVMRHYLEERGVPSGKIVEDPAGFDTYDSCVRARDVYGATELTVISQDYHLGRVIAICEQVGVDAVGVGDTTMLRRYPYNWIKGWLREFPANLKVLWDLWSERAPQQDPPDPSLMEAAGS